MWIAIALAGCDGGSSDGPGGDGGGGSGPAPEGPITIAASIESPAPAKVNILEPGDFDGDGKVDLIVAAEGGGLGVMKGQGDGTFTALSYDVFGPVLDIAVGDFDADGVLDAVVTAGGAAGGVFVYSGDGDASFTPAVQLAAKEGALAVADLNGDGHDDIVVAGGAEVVIAVFDAAELVKFAVAVPSSVRVADLDGDGDLDVVVGSKAQIERGVNVFLGDGTGAFAKGQVLSLGQGEVDAIAVADFTGDGKVDLVVPDFFGGQLLQGKGDGTFTAGASFATSPGDTRPFAMETADLNGGGVADLVVAGIPGSGPDSLDVLRGLPGGGLGPPAEIDQINTTEIGSAGLAVLDVDGDGRPDILATRGETIAFFRNTSE